MHVISPSPCRNKGLTEKGLGTIKGEPASQPFSVHFRSRFLAWHARRVPTEGETRALRESGAMNINFRIALERTGKLIMLSQETDKGTLHPQILLWLFLALPLRTKNIGFIFFFFLRFYFEIHLRW